MRAPGIELVLLCSVTATITFARIGDTPEQLQERYGKPIAESADADGNGLRIYRTTQFKEIRVTFVAGKSEFEKFTVADGIDPKTAMEIPRNEERQLKRALGMPDEDDSFEWSDRSISVGLPEQTPDSEDKFIGPKTGKTTAYVGTLQVEKKDRGKIGVLRDGDRVIEILFVDDDPELGHLKTGGQYRVTVLDQRSDDTRTPLAVVGKRIHVDWFDAVDDAHDRLQILVTIESNGIVIFDRAVCGVHHIAMDEREVPISYGLLAYSETERYCDKRFPHFREYAGGGCVEGEKKTTRIYICPACLAASKEYARTHPEK